MRITFDANILIYAVHRGTGDKHDLAVDFLRRAANIDCVVTLQSLSEFFNASTRKLGLSLADASIVVNEWCDLFPIVAADELALHQAIQTVQQHHFSFWDAMLYATADRAGCRVLLSEDLQDGRMIGRVRIINPFLDSNAAFIETALPPVS